MIVLILLISILVSYGFTAVLIKYAVRNHVLDIPNVRSSHSTPTPRGGGGAVVLTFMLGLIVFASLDEVSLRIALTLLISGGGIAIIGFMDDHKHINSGVRLLCHFLCAILIVYISKGLPDISFFGNIVELSFFGQIIALLMSVWVLNLFNFMDGIDGIAGVEVIVSALVMGAVLFFCFNNSELAILHFLLAFASTGFLIWNFPPAKIFMGDAGSGFIGINIAAFVLLAGAISEELFWAWLVMLGVFIVDATVTLLKRLIQGYKPHEAHCSHAYQIASRKYKSHLRVTISVLFINLFWLAPIAVLISIGFLDGFLGLIFAYAPLVLMVIWFNSEEK